MVFSVNYFQLKFQFLLITKYFMLDVKEFLDSTLHAIHQTCKRSQLIILNLFKYKMSRFLQFWCKLNTSRIVKTCPFRFLRDYNSVIPSMLCFLSFLTISYRFPWCFRIFPLVCLRFLRVFLQLPLSVSTVLQLG